MTRERYFIKLNEEAVLKLPYYGPLTRRIHNVRQRKNKEEIEEMFVQRKDAFATDLIYSINRLRNREISEIRFLCGLDGLIRIYLNEKGRLAGEYVCESRSSLNIFREKIGLSSQS